MFAELRFVERLDQRPTQPELAEIFRLTRDKVRYALEIVDQRFAHFLRDECVIRLN